jgi:hypothetical protein
MAASVNDAIDAVLNQLRGALGTGETPPGSNDNFIVDWYNQDVEAIGPGPWCEMTNTWAMWTGGAKDLKKGRAYTVWAAQDAVNGVNGSSWHFGTAGMQAGDQVYYDWNGSKTDIGAIDHTGTVEKINGDGTFYTLEGNLGDQLQRVLRDATYVVGYVRFDWQRLVTAPAPVQPPPPVQAPTPPPAPSLSPLAVDGQLGPQTISRWQLFMMTPVDGVISNPSQLVRAVQNYLNSKINAGLVVDGVGIFQDGHVYKTVKALQQYLGTTQDGSMSTPVSGVVKALQQRLNTGRF